jgi:hypothetical protein
MLASASSDPASSVQPKKQSLISKRIDRFHSGRPLCRNPACHERSLNIEPNRAHQLQGIAPLDDAGAHLVVESHLTVF